MRPTLRAGRSHQATRALVSTLALLAVALGLQSASAIEIGVDTALVVNPNPVFGDAFNNGIFDAPPWFTISGSPGPEVGETLAMHNGDFIYAPFTTNPDVATTAFTLIQLTDFPAGSYASMILFGNPGEFLSLTVTPGLAILSDGNGATLGSAPLPPSSDVSLLVTVIPQQDVIASVNGVSVYEDKVEFGGISGIGINVVPEPATLGLLGLGCAIMGVRRRLIRGRA